MSQAFGREVPEPHVQSAHRQATRYLLILPGSDGRVAKLFSAQHELLAQTDAASEDITQMTRGLTPEIGAVGAPWDTALAGLSAPERAAVEVYTLDV